MKKIVGWLIIVIVSAFVAGCIFVSINQEKLIFKATKLPANYQFEFTNKFEELTISAKDETKLNGLLFKSDSSKGLIFYLHGNAGMLDSWGNIAGTYTHLGYDIFILDYRGFGKSEGTIESEEQFFSDAQIAYNSLAKRYAENQIVIIGYSIGTGTAAMLASTNQPKLLILQAPYYSLQDLMKHHYSYTPTFLLRYPFETYKYVQNLKTPLVIFHGDMDQVIYYQSSLKLEKQFKPNDKLYLLKGQGHGGMNENETYVNELKKLLQ